MAGEHWDKIRTALGDEQPMSTRYIDEPDETWFAVMNKGIYVWSNGTLYKDTPEIPELLCDNRRLFYHHQLSLYVELAVYEDEGIMTCAVDNGFKRQFSFDPEEISEQTAHYESVGFKRVGPWHLSPDKVVVREYRTDDRRKVVVRVDGNHVILGDEDIECDDRAAAEALVEERVEALIDDGFRFVLIETMRARHTNPEPFTPPSRPDMKEWPEPQNANDAVDQAMARLEELHTLFPRANAVLEMIKIPEEEARGKEFVRDDFPVYLTKMPEDVPENPKNSFEYFLTKHRSITWAMLGTWNSADDYIPTFQSDFSHCANCAIELNKAEPFPDEWIEDYEMPDLKYLHVFEHRYAFDVRFTSEDGEHPVVDFDHQEPEVPEGPPDEIQPFGFWLLEWVVGLSEDVLPWLIETQG